MRQSEQRERQLLTLWGKRSFTRWRYRCNGCQRSTSVWQDKSLDESSLSPEAMKRVHDAGTLLSYRKASGLLESWGLKISKSKLTSLNQQLNEVLQREAAVKLKSYVKQALDSQSSFGCKWIVEIDGKFVPTRVATGLDWREVKTAVLYKMNSPNQRHYVSYLGHYDEFAEQVHGLLRHAGVKQEDRLVGLSDGATWIATVMGELGVHRHILDVYHASTYLETLMLHLGWTEEARELERRALLRGELDIQIWLNHFVPAGVTLAVEGMKALSYLEKQALLDHTCYPQFKQEGIVVIGSGQIEGANKAVIGGRLNLSGAHWSERGACSMALARAQFHSVRPIMPLDHIRHQAFPHPNPS